jgi:anti-anti-sigma regulatory factor
MVASTFLPHQEFMQAYRGLCEAARKRFVVDLQNTEYLDSSAMGMLLQLRDYGDKARRDRDCVNGNDAVQEILQASPISTSCSRLRERAAQVNA